MDERIRELERRAQSGDISAQAELLNLYIRISKIPRYRVELAAIYGDPAAAIITPPGRLTEEDFLFPMAGCYACGGTGVVKNIAKMSWQDPDTFPCECQTRPFGGVPFFPRRDDEIYVRRALIALDFVLTHVYSTYGTARINILQNINQTLLSYVDNCGAELVGCNEFDDFAAIARQNLALYADENIGWDRLSLLAEAYSVFFDAVINHHQTLTNLSFCRTQAITVLATEDPDEYEMFLSLPSFYPEQVAEEMVSRAIAEKMIPWLLTPED